jgi:hypothetical protein
LLDEDKIREILEREGDDTLVGVIELRAMTFANANMIIEIYAHLKGITLEQSAKHWTDKTIEKMDDSIRETFGIKGAKAKFSRPDITKS